MKLSTVVLIALGTLAALACGGAVPTATPETIATPAAMPSVASIATVRPPPTAKPTANPTSAPAPTLVPTATPVPLSVYTNALFQYSVHYPRGWTLLVENPQRVEIHNPLSTASLIIDVVILPEAVTNEEFTEWALEIIGEVREQFEILSNDGFAEGIATTYRALDPVDRRIWKSRMHSFVSGRFGLILTGSASEALFERYEAELTEFLGSIDLPDPGLKPPTPEISGLVMATGVDEVRELPIGATDAFDASASKIYAIANFENIPMNADVEFLWVKLDSTGEQKEVLNRTPSRFWGTRNTWAWVSQEPRIDRGYYETLITVNGETLAATQYSVGISEYVDERAGVGFSYPQDWGFTEPEPGRWLMSPVPGVRVQVVARMIGPSTLDAAMEALIEVFESIGFSEISRTRLDAEIPGYYIEWVAELDNGTSVQTDMVVQIHGARLHLFAATAPPGAYERLRTDFKLIRDSLRTFLTTSPAAIDPELDTVAITDIIGARMSEIRGLPPAPDLNIRVITRDEFGEENATEDLSEDESQELSRIKSLCVILDLCSPSDDLRAASQAVSSEGVLGTYRVDERAITLVLDGDRFSPADWPTFAHEYTHALQDSEYGLDGLVPNGISFDYSLALSALVEGDAGLADNLFFESLPASQRDDIAFTASQAALEFSESEVITDAPRILAGTFGWPHGAGLNFVFHLYLLGGQEAINDAFGDPPQSTEQILHPAKYISRDQPFGIQLPDLTSALGESWSLEDSGTLGELLTALYLGTYLSEDDAESAAEGWGGDRYSLLRDSQGRQLIAMLYGWDSDIEADEFYDAFLEWAAAKSLGEWSLIQSGESRRLWVGEDISVHIEMVRDTSLVIIGPDQASVESVIAAVSGLEKWVTE